MWFDFKIWVNFDITYINFVDFLFNNPNPQETRLTTRKQRTTSPLRFSASNNISKCSSCYLLGYLRNVWALPIFHDFGNVNPFRIYQCNNYIQLKHSTVYKSPSDPVCCRQTGRTLSSCGDAKTASWGHSCLRHSITSSFVLCLFKWLKRNYCKRMTRSDYLEILLLPIQDIQYLLLC